MRGYMRGAEIAGVMAEFLRGEGFSSRPQTNADSDVLHIPLILWAGLGELSRIGELVLNPYVGPRFKSVVVTSDMPLAAKCVEAGAQVLKQLGANKIKLMTDHPKRIVGLAGYGLELVKTVPLDG